MFFFWIIIAGLLQATVLNGFNLLLALAVFAGLKKGMLGGLLIGVGIGIFVGILSGASFGIVLIFYSAIGFISGAARSHLYYANIRE